MLGSFAAVIVRRGVKIVTTTATVNKNVARLNAFVHKYADELESRGEFDKARRVRELSIPTIGVMWWKSVKLDMMM